jgi:hypothetical protein
MSKYPIYDIISDAGRHVIIVKLDEDELWEEYATVTFDSGLDEDETKTLTRHLNATRFNPCKADS